MLLQNTILQQPSTSPIQSIFKSQEPKRNGYGGHRLPMLSVPVRVPECLDSLLALLFMSRKLGLKLARNEWHCCPVLVNNPWRHDPITGVDSFDVFGMEECSSADWNLKDTSAWGAFAHYTNRNSQHCPVMIANSKQ